MWLYFILIQLLIWSPMVRVHVVIMARWLTLDMFFSPLFVLHLIYAFIPIDSLGVRIRPGHVLKWNKVAWDRALQLWNRHYKAVITTKGTRSIGFQWSPSPFIRPAWALQEKHNQWHVNNEWHWCQWLTNCIECTKKGTSTDAMCIHLSPLSWAHRQRADLSAVPYNKLTPLFRALISGTNSG